MEELLKQVADQAGLSGEQGKSATEAVLGYLRGQVPPDKTGEFDNTVKEIGAQPDTLPQGLKDVAAVAEKTGLPIVEIGKVVLAVIGYLKAKLPADLFSKLAGAVSGAVQKAGGLGAILGKLGGLLGGGK